MHRRGVRRWCGVSCPHQVHQPPKTSTRPPTQELSEPCPFGFFMEASLHRPDWVESPMANDVINLQPLSPPWRSRGGGAESSNPLIPGLVLLATSPHLDSSKSHLIHIRHHYHAHPSGSSRSCRSSVPGKGTKTKYIFIINHNITGKWGGIIPALWSECWVLPAVT